jgi:ubiquinone/menaquinone biosynthesis C-methylase UbiE
VLPKLNKPRILDIGCGSGLPTMELAKLSDGPILGLDIDHIQLEKLNRKIREKGLTHRVQTINCRIEKMDFPDNYFDILWAEGVIRILGFEKSLKEWNRLLKPSGFLVIHDAISIITKNLGKIPSWGYELIDQIMLPKNAWWIECYQPLETRIKHLTRKYRHQTEALILLKKYQKQVDLVKNTLQKIDSAFFIMQKSEKPKVRSQAEAS